MARAAQAEGVAPAFGGERQTFQARPFPAFDLIISDIYVGGESSFSLAKEVLDRGKPIPFIFFADFGVDSSSLHYKGHIFLVVHKPHILNLLDRVCSLMSWSINGKIRV